VRSRGVSRAIVNLLNHEGHEEHEGKAEGKAEEESMEERKTPSWAFVLFVSFVVHAFATQGVHQ
jgi:hypothetical protein